MAAIHCHCRHHALHLAETRHHIIVSKHVILIRGRGTISVMLSSAVASGAMSDVRSTTSLVSSSVSHVKSTVSVAIAVLRENCDFRNCLVDLNIKCNWLLAGIPAHRYVSESEWPFVLVLLRFGDDDMRAILRGEL